MLPSSHPSLAAALLCIATAIPADATSYVVMGDGALADQAPLIVDGRIESASRAADAPDAVTEYEVAVNRPVKGAVERSTVTVRVLGGLPRDDGPWLHAWGVPRFDLGERVLLFLSPRDDGRFGLVQLALGAFRGVRHHDRLIAFRPELTAYAVAGGEERARDYEAFADWLEARARGELRPADYFTAPPPQGVRSLAERFALLEVEGRNLRWADFDYGVKVDYYAHPDGQPGMKDGGFSEVEVALWRWNHDPDSTVELRYQGERGSITRFYRCDGVNSFVFDDPEDEIEGSYDCSVGGVLAIGGICSRDTHRFRGKEYWTIQEGVILTQDKAGCTFGEAGGKVGEYIFAHEVGHTLGFGHSCGNGTDDRTCSDPANADAVMAGFVTGRARQGSRLGSDDRAALAALYPLADGGGGSGESDGWLSSREVPGFRFRVQILPGAGAQPIHGRMEDRCLAETLCVSGALAGRVEVQLRVVGPRPNGKLWPTFVKFTTSTVEIEVEQTATGETRTYTLEAAGPGEDVLYGLFDREGFDP